MSDNKKKTNGDVVPQSTPKSKFGEKFNKFISLCTEMKNDPAGAMDYEKTIEENAALKLMLKKRDEEAGSLKAEVQQLKKRGKEYLEDFGMKYSEYQARLEDGDNSKKTLGETQQTLEKTKKDMKKLESENKQLKKEARDLETAQKRVDRDFAKTKTECDNLQTLLKAAQMKIQFYAEGSLSPTDLDLIGDQFETFSEKCHQVVMECFEPCQAPPQKQNVQFLATYLDNCSGCNDRLPLTHYTSRSARLMRCAAAELVIANAMVNHIFTDIYLPGKVSRQNAISSTLELLLTRDSKREALVRCQLLAEFETDSDTLTSVCQAAFDEVCTVLDSLLPAGEPRDKFHTKLMALLNEAVELWRPLQRSEERVSAHLSVRPSMLRRDEDVYPDYDMVDGRQGASPNSPAFAGSEPVLLLFPMIYSNEQVVCPPTALWDDQDAFIEAGNEEAKHRLSISGDMVGAMDMNGPSALRRRMSAGARTPQSPTSALPHAGATRGALDLSGSHLVPTRRAENGVKAMVRSR